MECYNGGHIFGKDVFFVLCFFQFVVRGFPNFTIRFVMFFLPLIHILFVVSITRTHFQFTVEPRFTATPLIRSPRYYGHFFFGPAKRPYIRL